MSCLRCNTPKKCAAWGCSPLTWPAEQPEGHNMNDIVTDITINVYPDPDYHYEVSAGDVISVAYVEHINEHNTERNRRWDVSFGSLKEMEAVAQAMLKVVANGLLK